MIYEAVRKQLLDLPYDYEILFIDNKSQDRTREIIREICAEDKHFKAIFNVKNFGQFNSPYTIYQAINESDEVHVFDLHQNPNDECIVGRHIRPVLAETFREVEEKAERQLKQTTLADCMEKMRIRIGEEQ